jgi:hypothetical protein
MLVRSAGSAPPALVDMHGRLLTSEQTDATLAEMRRRSDDFVVALQRLAEVNSLLPSIMRDEFQGRRPEVTQQLTAIGGFWRDVHKTVSLEAGSYDFYTKMTSGFAYNDVMSSLQTAPGGPMRFVVDTSVFSSWLGSSWKSGANVEVVGDSSWFGSGEPVQLEGNVAKGPFHTFRVIDDLADRSVATSPPDAINDAAAALLANAKRDLAKWLGCGTVRLSKLLVIARQTLHDVGKATRRQNARTSAAILDAHVLVQAFLDGTDTASRLAWLRGPGLALWEGEGMDAFRDHLDAVVFPIERRQPSEFAIVLDEAEPSVRVDPHAPAYDGPKGRF